MRARSKIVSPRVAFPPAAEVGGDCYILPLSIFAISEATEGG